MSTPPPAFLQPPWFFVFFAIFWLAVSVAISYSSGWRTLADWFRSAGPIEGERFRFASGSMVASRRFPTYFRGCLSITIGAEGFLLSVFLPFRFGNPPLFIPWARVESVTEEKHAWFADRVVICIHGLPIKIAILGQAGKRISQAYARWHVKESAFVPQA